MSKKVAYENFFSSSDDWNHLNLFFTFHKKVRLVVFQV